MATEMKVPALGEGVEGGKILTLEVAVGDQVTEGQTLFELETGKATVEVPASADGVIESLTVGEGDELSVGDVFGTLAGGEATATDSSDQPEAPAAQEDSSDAEEAETEEEDEDEAEEAGEASEINIEVPALGEGVEGGTVVSMDVAAGDEVSEGQTLFELETGKATVEVPAPASGTLNNLSVSEGDEIKVGDSIGTMTGKGSAPQKVKKAKKKTDKTQTKPVKAEASSPSAPVAPLQAAAARPNNSPVPASPSVRKFAREIGVDINQVPGNGPRGRIQMQDVKAWSKQLHQQQSAAPAVAAAPVKKVPLPDFSKFGKVEKEKMNAIRRMTVDHMDNCWSTIPHVTQFDEADVTDLEALRKSFQPKAEKAGTKLTMTAMLIKIMGSALKAFPTFNASIDSENEEIIYKKYFNVGCAVDTPKGLVVPVIRGVDGLNMIEISKELGDMAGNMRDGKINPSMLQGGCITLSNLGGLSGKHFTPIVNGPEVAILGVGRASMKPVWQNGEFVPRLMMPLSLSYDHRLIDGANGTRFMRWIVDAIEQPLLISLEG
ncbi:2-oxo acid dehydrogenase subunit E2 [Kiritimatiellota bacterium B12222]|nr:2-oxo acid dehydrogenase subunit E2 [Kiritimatiellota bacterium B12222]